MPLLHKFIFVCLSRIWRHTLMILHRYAARNSYSFLDMGITSVHQKYLRIHKTFMKGITIQELGKNNKEEPLLHSFLLAMKEDYTKQEFRPSWF
jgi:hypothetical protein